MDAVDEPCRSCRGACCESVSLVMGGVFTDDQKRWLEFHGLKVEGVDVRIPVRCEKLVDGRCGIYETRPQLCRMYVVWGQSCRAVMRMEGTNGPEG